MNNPTEQLLGSLNEFLAFARGRLGDPELAADVVQESLLKAVRHAGDLRDDESAKAWFYRILRRTIADLCRRNDAQRRLLERARNEPEPEPEPDEERVVCACVQRLLPALKPEYAEVLLRVDLDGADAASVAATLGVTRNNLTVRLHRARRQLRERVEETCRVCATHGCLDCHCDTAAGEGR
jgi:RNA polymerase sigma factor (sigma-70 family)